MIRKLMLSIVFFGVSITGCATDPNRTSAANDSSTGEAVRGKTTTVAATNDSRADSAGDGVICRLEKPLGSHRSRKVCRSQESIDATMRKTQGGLMSRGRSGGASGESGN